MEECCVITTVAHLCCLLSLCANHICPEFGSLD